MPVEIFCSYAHEDEVWRRKLEGYLSLLQQQNLISFWHDRLIVPGTNWAKAIDTHLETASILLLLISEDFFASNYCVGIEMKRALERQEAGEALIIPILVRVVQWHESPLAHLQSLPTDAQPITTWQDEERAFADVAAGIRRAVEALPLLAASASRVALPAVWNVPYPRNPFFLGRDAELQQIHHLLHAGQTTALSQPQAISGLGGIGKTQLALEYAYRYHSAYQRVFWAHADSKEALISSYLTFASLLRLPEREAREQDIPIQAVKTWLQTHRDWLLILDNADELDLLPDMLPSYPGGHVLLTTRAAWTGRLAHRLEIETLLPEQAALFLLRRATLIAPDAELAQATEQEQALALQIAQELGGLPLALDQAGAYMEETGTDLEGYWQIYQQRRADVLRLRGGLIHDHPAPVATTWSLSFQRVEAKNPAAAELLRLCASLAPDAIPEEILTTGATMFGPILAPVAGDAFQLGQTIEALRAYSLIRRDPRTKTLSIHRLVQVVVQDTLNEAEKRVWAEKVVQAVNATFPHPEPDNWEQCERLLPQGLATIKLIEIYQIGKNEAGRLLHETASYLRDRARYAEAELFYQRALHIKEHHLGPDHLLVAYSLNGLARLYYDQGKDKKAEPLYQRALHIREQHLGPDHLDVATSLNNLASLYYDQGNYTQAESLHLRALRIREHHLEPDNVLIAASLHNLGILYKEQGRYAEAERLHRRAIQIFNQHSGPKDPWAAHPLHNLAELYRVQGRYAEAEPLYRQAHQIFEQQLGSKHPLVADTLNGLANLYREQRKYGEAEVLYQQALHIREQVLEPEHPDTAETLYGLAQLREVQGNHGEASILYTRALTIYKQMLGDHHPKTNETRQHFISLLQSRGRDEEAATLLEEDQAE